MSSKSPRRTFEEFFSTVYVEVNAHKIVTSCNHYFVMRTRENPFVQRSQHVLKAPSREQPWIVFLHSSPQQLSSSLSCAENRLKPRDRMSSRHTMAFRSRLASKLVMAVASRRNFFIRLFGLLVIASLFTSYLIFVQVNADDQKVHITRERSRKDSNIAIGLTPERRSDRNSRRRETVLEPPRLVQATSAFLHGNSRRGENSREDTSFRQNSERTGYEARQAHGKKSKWSVLKETFRDNRARRTAQQLADSYMGAQANEEKNSRFSFIGNTFRDNIGMRGTFTKSVTTTSVPGSMLNDKSSVIADSIRGNSHSQKAVNKPLESRNVAAMEDAKNRKISTSLDDISHDFRAHGTTTSKQIEDQNRTVLEHVNTPSSTLYDNSSVISESFRDTDSARKNVNRVLESRSTTAMENVKETVPTTQVNSRSVSDTLRPVINARTTVKTHLEPTSMTTIKDAKKPSSTPRYNPLVIRQAFDGTNKARVTVLKQKSEQVTNMATPGVTFARRNLIIVAQPRTGSSFLGDAFNQHPEVFYLFEPLHGIVNSPLQHLNDRRPMQFLAGMLQCKFTSLNYVKQIEKFRRFSSNALSSPPLCVRKTFLETPRKKCDSLNTRNMETVCKMNYSVTVMKILTSRIPNGKVESLLPLCNSSNCTIIYLVRDPRPVVFSHMKVGIQSWQNFKIRANDNAPRPSIKMYSAQVCRQIEENVKKFQNLTGLMKNRYYLLRYEDLARNATETLRRVFKMAGLNMANSTLQWIKLHTGEVKSNTRDDKGNFSTKRNSKAVYDKWRLEIDPCVVNIIEDNCRSVLKLLGYKPLYGSEQMQYNLNVSLSDGI